MKDGKLIAIEGTDGSGKGVQSELLVERLRREGYTAERIDFPRYGKKSAGPIEEYLNGQYGNLEDVGAYPAALLYAIDRYAAKGEITSLRTQGTIVVCNRYVLSNSAHQGSKLVEPAERKKFFTWQWDLEYRLLGIPRADCTILLKVPVPIAEGLIDQKGKRAYLPEKKRDIHEADPTHLQRTEKIYQELSAQDSSIYPIMCVEDEHLLSSIVIHERIWNLLVRVLQI